MKITKSKKECLRKSNEGVFMTNKGVSHKGVKNQIKEHYDQ
jgi:hypothetical protein